MLSNVCTYISSNQSSTANVLLALHGSSKCAQPVAKLLQSVKKQSSPQNTHHKTRIGSQVYSNAGDVVRLPMYQLELAAGALHAKWVANWVQTLLCYCVSSYLHLFAIS